MNEDIIKTLFVSSTSTKPVQKEANRKSALPQVVKENRVSDAKRSQNIAIILRALNVTIEEVSEALLDGEYFDDLFYLICKLSSMTTPYHPRGRSSTVKYLFSARWGFKGSFSFMNPFINPK